VTVAILSDFFFHDVITGLLSRATRRMSLVEQELLTIPEDLILHQFLL
jgi:hypothetical protein